MTSTYTTGSNGCVNLSYSKKTPKWYNPCTAWDCPGYTNPDIYCVVTKTDYFPLYTDTKEDWNQDLTANFGTVHIFPDRVSRGDAGGFNGCGPASAWDGINKVADFLTGFSNQCNNHDLCYSNCGETKAACDEEFLDMMESECNDEWDFEDKDPCKTVAYGMYALVRDFGQDAFDASRGHCV